MREGLCFIPVLQMRKTRLSDLPKVTQLVSGGARVRTQEWQRQGAEGTPRKDTEGPSSRATLSCIFSAAGVTV